MTARGCAYAGSKGVVWDPIKDMIHISHGPVGCGYWSWSGRRNYYLGTTGIDTFGTMHFTSDFQERDIVFGGDKKLTKLIEELDVLFPLNRGVSIESDAPIGLIGDDIEAVARNTSKTIGKPVIPVRCEGFRGVSQSLGHHIANDMIRDWVFPRADKAKKDGTLKFEGTPYDVAIIGDYNIGGDAWAQPYPVRRNRLARSRSVVWRRYNQRNVDDPQREDEPHPLLPLDELHQPSHGRSLWYTLVRI